MKLHRIDETDQPITWYCDGHSMIGQAGESVASAMLAAGLDRFGARPVSGVARAPYCMMGICQDCLVEIDGRAARQACLTPLVEDMHVRTTLSPIPRA